MTSASKKQTFTKLTSRHIAAMLMSLITAVVMIPGMTTYLPFATPDRIGVPIFLFPFIWAGLFIYSYMAKKVSYVWVLLLLLCVSHALLSYLALS